MDDLKILALHATFTAISCGVAVLPAFGGTIICVGLFQPREPRGQLREVQLGPHSIQQPLRCAERWALVSPGKQ